MVSSQVLKSYLCSLASSLLLVYSLHSQQPNTLDYRFGVKGIASQNIFRGNDCIFDGTSIALFDNSNLLISGNGCNGYLGAIFPQADGVFEKSPSSTVTLPFNSQFDLATLTDVGRTRLMDTKSLPDGSVLIAQSFTPPASVSAKENASYSIKLSKVLKNGNIDKSFGTNGFVTAACFGYGVASSSIELLPNGGFILVSYVNSNGAFYSSIQANEVYVQRFSSTGIKDINFGNNGERVFNLLMSPSETRKPRIAISKSGNIAVAGMLRVSDFEQYPTIYLMNQNGQYISSFGNFGQFIYQQQGGYFTQIRFDNNENMLVSGHFFNGLGFATGYKNSFLTKIDTASNISQNFGTNGFFTKRFRIKDGSDFPEFEVAATTSDKKIIAYGNEYGLNVNQSFICRFFENGNLDLSFGTNGTPILDIGFVMLGSSFRSFHPQQLIINAAGELIFLNSVVEIINGKTSKVGCIVLKTDANGNYVNDINGSSFVTAFKNEFGFTGLDMNAFGSRDNLVGFGVLPKTNKSLVITRSSVPGRSDVVDTYIQRINSTGSRDTTSTGATTIKRILRDSSLPYSRPRDFTSTPDGGFLYILKDTLLAKIDSTGKIDSSFATNGIYSFASPANAYEKSLRNIEVAPDGSILFAYNYSLPNGFRKLFIIRLLNNGVPDNSWGGAGNVDAWIFARPIFQGGHIIRSDNQKNVFIFELFDRNQLFRIGKFLPNGQLDQSFGTNNSGILPFIPPNDFRNEDESLYALYLKDAIVKDDGKLLLLLMKEKTLPAPWDDFPDINLTPDFNRHNYRDIVVVSFNQNGSPDNNFGGIPKPLYGNASFLHLPFIEEIPESFLVRPDGRILIAAYLYDGAGWDIGLITLNSNGSYRSTCATDGIGTAGGLGFYQPHLYDIGEPKSLKIAIAGDSLVYIAGTVNNRSDDAFVARFFEDKYPPTQFKKIEISSLSKSCDSLSISYELAFHCNLKELVVERVKNNGAISTVNRLNASGIPKTSLIFKTNFSDKQEDSSAFFQVKAIDNNGKVVSSEAVYRPLGDPAASFDTTWYSTSAEGNNLFRAVVYWRTGQNSNANNFTIELSDDNITYKKVGIVQGAGPSIDTVGYKFTLPDPLPVGMYQVRITATGNSCESPFGIEQEIIIESGTTITVFPNPTNNFIIVEFSQNLNQFISITNLNGRTLQQIQSSSRRTTIDLSAYPKGLYFITIKDSGGKKIGTKKVIKL